MSDQPAPAPHEDLTTASRLMGELRELNAFIHVVQLNQPITSVQAQSSGGDFSDITGETTIQPPIMANVLNLRWTPTGDPETPNDTEYNQAVTQAYFSVRAVMMIRFRRVVEELREMGVEIGPLLIEPTMGYIHEIEQRQPQAAQATAAPVPRTAPPPTPPQPGPLKPPPRTPPRPPQRPTPRTSDASQDRTRRR